MQHDQFADKTSESPSIKLPISCEVSYDRVADEYVKRIFDELQHKPFDRHLLDRFADSVRDLGPACDIGCGPGQVARYLFERGVAMTGIDLSNEMIQHARSLTSGVNFVQGDMRALPVPDSAWAGATAFYSLIHIPPAEMVKALSEVRRALQPGGVLLLCFHIGDNPKHLELWWGREVCLDFHHFQSNEMVGYLTAAGFEIEDVLERDPYPEVEHQSHRSYIFARRPMSP